MVPERFTPLLVELAPLAERFHAAGHRLYLVGGVVRDLLLGTIADDFDIDLTTDARPSRVKSLLRGWADAIWTQGEQFGTIGARHLSPTGEARTLEITTFRAEAYRDDSRKPSVTFAESVDVDLSRRDFTINAMALEVPAPGGAGPGLVDPYGGAADLAARVLRTPLTPEISFEDDPLRMLRAARFVARFDLKPESELVDAVAERGARLSIVSAERIRDELDKLVVLDHPAAGLWFCVDTGLAEHFLPELPALRLEHDPIHRHKDVLSHTIAVIDNVRRPDVAAGRPFFDFRLTRLAALFHDIGKPRTRGFQKGKGTTFHHHDAVGARMTRKRMEALRYPTADIDAVVELVALHLRFHTYRMGWSDSAVRRYVRDAGPLLAELNVLTRCDCTTRDPRKAAMLARRMDELEERIDDLAAAEELAALRPELDGADVMELLDIPPGPAVGRALAFLLEVRLDEGLIGREAAAARLQEWYAAVAGAMSDDRRYAGHRSSLIDASSRTTVDPLRDDLTDGVTMRRRAATWRWVVSVVVAAGLLVFIVALVVRTGDSRSRPTVIVLGTASGLALLAVAVTWLESRRIAHQFRRTIDRLVDTEAELRLLLDDLPEAVISIDEDGLVRGANTKAAELTGRPVSELTGRPVLHLFAPADHEAVGSWLADCRKIAGVEPITVSRPRPDGVVTAIEVSYDQPRRAERGAIVRLRDVSEREERIRALELARRRFHQAFHSAPTGMALVRLDNSTIVDANRSLAEMLQRPTADLVGRSIREITHPDDLKAAAAYRNRLELGIVDTYLLDQRYLRSDGEYIWARTRVAITMDDQIGDTSVPLAITHIEDVTEQLRTADQLRWAATHDDLTGLPNRTELLERVDLMLAGAPAGSVALLFIDLDNFKNVNDSLGHGIGDHLLSAMARRLRGAVDRDTRDRDVLLGRFGGDEFIVIVSVLEGDEFDPEQLAERLRGVIREAVDVDGTELYVTASIGYSTNSRPGTTGAELLRDADAAMYRAKARGRDCVEAYSPGSHESTVLALRTATELRRAVERNEIVPYFQPIVELTTGHVVGFEALARWLHPDRGLLAPDQFLPLAEETGLLGSIGELVLRDGLAQLARWRARDLPFAGAYLSVNVGTRQVVDPTFAALVADLLAETGIPADSVWLEITETALLADVKASIVALRNLRGLGLHLAVDDFGTGYSSLTYLKRFPVQAIKIDRSFVAGVGLDADDTTIVEAVVKLGHSFGIEVIAEGIETPLQLSRLRALGCDRGQGYLFGRPRPASIVETERV